MRIAEKIGAQLFDKQSLLLGGFEIFRRQPVIVQNSCIKAAVEDTIGLKRADILDGPDNLFIRYP